MIHFKPTPIPTPEPTPRPYPELTYVRDLGHAWNIVAYYDWRSTGVGNAKIGVTWLGDLWEPAQNAIYEAMRDEQQTVVQVTHRVGEHYGAIYAHVSRFIDPVSAYEASEAWVKKRPAVRDQAVRGMGRGWTPNTRRRL